MIDNLPSIPKILRRKTTTSEILNNDKDREETYQKIVELLIAAGYFRARIQNLEPFDKKKCIKKNKFSKVSEKITSALKSVNCPYIINPVQIQGLDLPAVFQVLQWLVKNLLETRDERNEINLKTAEQYFIMKFEKEAERKQVDKERILNFNKTKYTFLKQGRQFRPVNNHKFEYNDPLRIYFTMLEFGMNKDVSFQKTLIELLKKKNMIEDKTIKTEEKPQSGTKDSQKQQEAHSISKEEKKVLEDIVNANVKQVVQTSSYHRINTSVMEEIFTENIDSIVNEIKNYENFKGDENVDRIQLFLKEKERLDNNKNNIVSQLEDYDNEVQHLDKKIKNNNTEKEESTQEIKRLTQTLEDNKTNLNKLNEQIKSAKITEEKLYEMTEKIKHREELKSAVSKFKKDCLEEKKEYDKQTEILEKKVSKMSNSENSQVFEEIDQSYQAEYSKLVEKKKDLFERNKVINLLTRKIQISPSKLELIQYQKRFQELYDQINLISEKSKKILNELNSKEEVTKLLNQKLGVFVQLKDALKNSKSKKQKEEFKDSMNSVLNSLTESVMKSADKLKQINKQIEESQTKLNELHLYETKYMKLIKEYNKEYNKVN